MALRSALMGSLYGAGGAFFTFRPVFMSAVVRMAADGHAWLAVG